MRVSSFRSFHGVALLAGPDESPTGNLLQKNEFRIHRLCAWSKLNGRFSLASAPAVLAAVERSMSSSLGRNVAAWLLR
jgi:hypothetical protein